MYFLNYEAKVEYSGSFDNLFSKKNQLVVIFSRLYHPGSCMPPVLKYSSLLCSNCLSNERSTL